VFTLCHIGEQSTSEVSAALGLSEATVRVHLFRAVRKLRKLLAPAASQGVA
jgi:DNA-directed RNA polymerase specialized sigma24 family protein